ncbi:SdpI/YhfL protein family protein [Microbacterium sp. cf046]|uniref:SdpI family protein n=1 Tax=Microbacterium sp. cf046 TaxID=1761803 RepID=UPI0008E18015|nr:SdpI family protein [Microbacterium sp. cf046]SFS17077.1 SdpI/YhfL protein family protein [Microbacterium sp. cf046]
MDIALAGCIGFSIVAVLAWLIVILIRLGRFRRNRWLGINTEATQASDEAWDRAHAAAAPWILGAAIAATAGALLCGVALVVGPETSVGTLFGAVGFFLGVAGVAGFSLRGFSLAQRAVRIDY